MLSLLVNQSAEATTAAASLGSRLYEGVGVTVVGMVVVFAILILICGILYLSNYIIYATDKNKEQAAKSAAVPAVPIAPAAPAKAQQTVSAALTDDKELVAVIAAAIAASANISPDRLVIRSIRRAKRSKWQSEAISEQQNGL